MPKFRETGALLGHIKLFDMRTIFYLFCWVACSFSMSVQAQYYHTPNIGAGENPGDLNKLLEYPLGQGLDASWSSIHSGSATSPEWTAIQSIPFPFYFNGNLVTHFKVSTSGVLTFDTAAASVPPGSNANLPDAGIPDNSICIWGLEGSGSNDNIVKQTFGAAPHQQHWIFFSSYNFEGSSGSCWTYWSIVLEETTNYIYLVDQRNTSASGCDPELTLGVQIDANTAYEIPGSPNITSHANADQRPVDNTYYTLAYGNQPDHDLTVTQVYMFPRLALAKAPFDIEGYVRSIGLQPVNAFHINYRVNGGSIVSDSVGSITIDTFGYQYFSHATPWTPASAGSYTIDIWASNINGNADQDPLNDTASVMVTVYDTMTPRMVLHEVFTSSTSNASVAGNDQLEGVLNANAGNYTMIRYPMSWPSPGDPYNTEEADDRQFYYYVQFVPRLFLDNYRYGNPSSYSQASFDYYYNNAAFVNIDADYAVYCDSISINISIDPLIDHSSNNLVLHTVIVENETTENIGGNGETYFTNVMMKMLPDADGNPLSSLVTGVTQTQSYQYKLPSTLNIEETHDLSVVVFIQDNATREIWQSVYANDLIENDGALVSGLNGSFDLSNLPFSIGGTFKNYQDNPVTSFGVNYQINDEPVVSGTIDNLSLDFNQSKSFSHPVKWNPTTVGNHVIKLWISNLNGNDEDELACNDSLQKTIFVTNNFNAVEDPEQPAAYFMVFPNPASEKASLSFQVDNREDVTVTLIDVLGENIRQYRYPERSPGTYQEDLDLQGISNGIYQVRFQAGDRQFIRKLLILK